MLIFSRLALIFSTYLRLGANIVESHSRNHSGRRSSRSAIWRQVERKSLRMAGQVARASALHFCYHPSRRNFSLRRERESVRGEAQARGEAISVTRISVSEINVFTSRTSRSLVFFFFSFTSRRIYYRGYCPECCGLFVAPLHLVNAIGHLRD